MHKPSVFVMARGILILAVCGFSGVLADSQSAPNTGSTPKDPTKSPKIEFRLGGNMGEVETMYGVHMGFMGFTGYTAPDGIGLMVYYSDEDRHEALRAFTEEIARAAKVVKRGEKRDRTGKVVGERAEILESDTKPAAPFHAIIWTDGGTFRKIASSSLQDALALEKVYRY